ncbi:MAG: putative peptidase [Prokaryotic dsDNA virus sp.]|nr:MAG: putative peptidase [Prokaryotic dsDNA virus sp.]|tara:strand:+ start:3353 stop:4567 length:1215 start_codon:yes stop_codon:yes gene_type:complete
MEKNTTKIVELVIDENHEEITIDAISLVTEPAIAENFVYFKKDKHNLTLAKVDEEQKLLVSPALIPNKQIYRFDAETNQEYYVYFTEATVKKASEMYLKYNNNNNATVQHENKVTGVHTVESWIVQNPEMDKSKLYGYDVPKGTWFVSMRIENEEIIERIKNGELRGLSIEGYFTDKMAEMSKFARVGSMVTDGKDGKIDLPLYDNEDEALAKAKELGCDGVHSHSLDGKEVFMPCSDHDIISNLSEILKEDCGCEETELISPNPCTSGYKPIGHKIKDGRKVPNCVPVNAKKKKKKKKKRKYLESYNDYPQSATNNAKRAIKWKEENGTTCGTRVGWTRAGQLARRENITRDTIARMASFKRHQQNKDVPYTEGCGGLMWDAWGGSSGINWAISKLKKIDSKK